MPHEERTFNCEPYFKLEERSFQSEPRFKLDERLFHSGLNIFKSEDIS